MFHPKKKKKRKKRRRMETKKKVNEWNINKMFIVVSGDSNNFSIHIKKLIIIIIIIIINKNV